MRKPSKHCCHLTVLPTPDRKHCGYIVRYLDPRRKWRSYSWYWSSRGYKQGYTKKVIGRGSVMLTVYNSGTWSMLFVKEKTILKGKAKSPGLAMEHCIREYQHLVTSDNLTNELYKAMWKYST